MNESNILLYETEEGKVNIDVVLKDETIWLTQKSMSELFECSTDNVGLHLKNIYNDQELDVDSTAEKFSVVRKEGNRNVKRKLEFYNLDAIIAVGYRVNSKKATIFFDDKKKNVLAAIECGINSFVFKSIDDIKNSLKILD